MFHVEQALILGQISFVSVGRKIDLHIELHIKGIDELLSPSKRRRLVFTL